MKRKKKGDVRLDLHQIPVEFSDQRSTGVAIAEGNNAAWPCSCGEQLIGRCYFQFGHDCHTICSCGRLFRVLGDDKKRAIRVREYPSRQEAA
jgi:hypothetical protein